MSTRPISLAALLRIDPRDQAGLRWARNRARFWITALKRRRKYLPKCDYSPEEMALFQALLALEAAAGELLKRSANPQRN